jgi:hypothetical protein
MHVSCARDDAAYLTLSRTQAIASGLAQIEQATGCWLMPATQRPAQAAALTTLVTEIEDEPLSVTITLPVLAFVVPPANAAAASAAQYFAQLDYATVAATLRTNSECDVELVSICPHCARVSVCAERLAVSVNGAVQEFELGKTVFLSLKELCKPK